MLSSALAAALLLLGCSCSAQHLWPGYAVMLNGDSVLGAVRVSSAQQQQSHIRFVPLSGTMLLLLRPEEVRAYGYIKSNDTVRYISCSFPVGTVSSYTKLVNGQRQVVHGMATLVMRLFLRELVAGPVRLYERNVINGSRSTSSGRRELLLARQGQPMVNTYWWNFSKNAAAFFNDDTVLATDLQHGRYRPRDLPQIVQRYNREQTAATSPAR
ncbi:MAG: hypothetical protein JWR44_1655 [Hymenobacter sp.]|jgi:hypothetical protein|nr:hypothetical protein [Hymenobacter sp.]